MILLFFYSIGIFLFELVSRVAAVFDSKAKLWIEGRTSWKSAKESEDKPTLWIHCSSVGEFEQARPIIEASNSQYFILLTFFSPSGFQSKRAFDLADEVCYLPTDFRTNARKFLDKFNPQAIIFVKYEFWYNFMEVISRRRIPLALISAYFPKDYGLFKWPGRLLGNRLVQFNRIFVQDSKSATYLKDFLSIESTEVCGDTRVDRVVHNRENSSPLDLVKSFVGDEQVLVVGSNWQADDERLIPIIKKRTNLKVIVAPHELGEKQKSKWVDEFGEEIIDFNQLENGVGHGRVLYVNRIGMLSSLYQYSSVAYVGGGFGAAVHNTLEAAVWGVPVICGPNNQRFLEIQDLKAAGVVFEAKSGEEIESLLERLLDSSSHLKEVEAQATSYFNANSGATQRILDWLDSAT